MKITPSNKHQVISSRQWIGFMLPLLFTFYFLLFTSPVQAAAVIGKFPSLLGSDGARAIDTDIVWLGESRDRENNSKQTDADTDDGVSAEFNSCAASRAYFLVHLKNPGKTSGVAYLNLWADWNKDGQWAGSDKCAPEWAVKNYEIDLSKQTGDIWVYAPEFTAGENAGDIWYRTAISYNEKLIRDDGGGEFAAGEVEDYGPLPLLQLADDSSGAPRRSAKDYSLACAPQPVALNHGESREFTVGPAFVGSEVPVSTGFSSKNAGLNAGGTSIDSTDKNVTKKPKNPDQFGDPDNPFVYTSKEVHDIGATVRDSVTITATYADGRVSEATCAVFVWHPPFELPGGPVPRTPGPDDEGHDERTTVFGPRIAPVKEEAVPVPPEHNIILSALQDGVGWVKKTGGKIIDGLSGGSKEKPPVVPPQPPAPQPPVEPPLHDDISTAIHDDALSEFIERETPNLFPPQHSTWRSLFLPPKPPEDIEHSINLSKYIDARFPPLFGGERQPGIPQETFNIFNLPPLIQWIFPPTPEPSVVYTPDGKTTVGSGGELQFEPRSPLEEWPSVVCSPSPLAIPHGGNGTIDLSVNDPLGADPNSVKMRGSPSNLGKRAGNALVWKYSDFATADGQGKVRLADNPSLDDQHPYKPSISFYSTEVHDIGMAVSSSFEVTLDYRLGANQGYRQQSVTGTCSVVVTHPPKEPTTPTHDTQKSRITETPTGGEPGEDLKQPVPQPVPPTQTPNFLQRILNLPPLLQVIGEPVVGETVKQIIFCAVDDPACDDAAAPEAIGRISESIKRGIICLSNDPACGDGDADSGAISRQVPAPGPVNFANARRLRELIFGDIAVGPDDIISPTSIKRVEIILPAPELVFNLPSPTQELEKITPIISPFNFLSNRLIDLSSALRRLAAPAPVVSVPIVPAPPRCFAGILEDTSPKNFFRYQYEAECSNYQSCAFEIRNLTSTGELVSRKTFDLPKTVPLINTDYIPTAAAVATLQVTCDGNTYTAIAHNFKSGGNNPAGNTAAGVAPNITTTSLPDGTNGTAYSQTVSATGGVEPYQFTISSGALPTGLSINSSTGVISGTPTVTATFNFTVRATSPANGLSDDQALSIIIAAGIADLNITTTDVPDKTAGVPSSDTIVATGGTEPYTWSINTLSVPCLVNNYAINSGTGALTSNNAGGTGTCTLTLHVEDAQGTPDTDEQVISFDINAP